MYCTTLSEPLKKCVEAGKTLGFQEKKRVKIEKQSLVLKDAICDLVQEYGFLSVQNTLKEILEKRGS